MAHSKISCFCSTGTWHANISIDIYSFLQFICEILMLFASLMTVDNLQVDKMIENIQKSILPTENEVQHLIRHSKSIFYIEPNVLALTGDYFIVGDIHGQFYDLLNIFKITDFDHSKKYLFLGDIVDRGYNSVETLILLLLYKVKYPSNIYIIRGNHETREATSNYGFMTECKAKFGLVAYLEFCSLFDYLPLCAVINNDIFCVHGGIVPDMDLNDLNDKFRLEDDSVHEMFWSDPSEDDGFAANPRGAGFLFGELQVEEFLQKHNLKKIVRSHQLVMEGYKEYYSGKLVTIWSAPNYCYVSGNIACVMEVKENNEFRYICFDAVENQK